MSAIKLFTREYGSENTNKLIILHGLFGMSDNWTSMGKYFSKHYHIIIPDLRNHGNSPHTEEFNYELMCEDIIDLMDEKHIDKAIILGHSMGGKLTMNLAFQYPHRIDKIIIADMSMAEGEFREIHAAILNTISKTDLSKFENYTEIQEYFTQFIPQRKIVLFAMKNIRKKTSGGFEWKLNYYSLYNNIHKIMEEVVPTEPYTNPALFIRGEYSDYVSDQDFEEIQRHFPQAILKTIPKASHWVHADNSELFIKLIEDFMDRHQLS